jgi:hypothetical protein
MSSKTRSLPNNGGVLPRGTCAETMLVIELFDHRVRCSAER